MHENIRNVVNDDPYSSSLCCEDEDLFMQLQSSGEKTTLWQAAFRWEKKGEKQPYASYTNLIHFFPLIFQVLLYSWMVYAVCFMSSTMWFHEFFSLLVFIEIMYYFFSLETKFRKCIVYIFFLTFQVLLYSWMVYAVCVMSSTMWWVMCWPTLTSTPPTSFCQNSNWGTYFVYLSCIANLNVLLIFLVANLQNRALSLHGVIVLQPPGVGLQAVPTCRVALVGLSSLL